MIKWYLATSGGPPRGPIHDDALLRMIRDGSLGPDMLAWSEGMSEWVPVSRVPELLTERARRPTPAPDSDSRTRVAVLRAPAAAPVQAPPPPVFGAPGPGPAPSPYASTVPAVGPAAYGPAPAPFPAAPSPLPARPPRTPPAPAPTAPGPTPAPSAPAPAPHPQAPAAPAPAPTAPSATQRRVVAAVIFVLAVGGGIFVTRLVLSRREAQTPDEGIKTWLFAPCLGQSLPELKPGSKAVPCAGASLAVATDASGTTLKLLGAPAEGMAAKTPELVSRILPNLPAPPVSRALPMRQLLRLDLRAAAPDAAHRALTAINTYQSAELLVEGYELMGGHRFARWQLKEGRVDADNEVTPDGPQIVVRFFPGQDAPSPLKDAEQGLEGPDSSWLGKWKPHVDPPELVELRKTIMKQGWWYDDAEAFLNAGEIAGLPRTLETVAGLTVVAQWLRTSDQWEVHTRSMVWNECFARRLGTTAANSSRQRYDEIAGMWKDAASFVQPPASRGGDDAVAAEGRAFNAAIGSTTHAHCALAMAEKILSAAADAPENRVLREATGSAGDVARQLIRSSRFLAALSSELVIARTRLLKPGPPSL